MLNPSKTKSPRRAGLTILIAAALAASCSSAPLDAPEGPPIAPVTPRPPAAMTIGAIPSGAILSNAAMAYEGGKLSDKREFVVGGVLVEHPKGKLLFDAGFGRDVATHFQTTKWLMRMTVKHQLDRPVAEQLAAAGLRPQDLTAVVLTHAHWDHVSGLQHLKGVPVWVSAAEMAYVRSGAPSARLARDLGLQDYRPVEFPDGPYLGYPASRDVFDDGSVVLVPDPGHTPGSLIAFVNLPDGKRYALIGDTAWQREGVLLPSQKPWMSRSADADAAATRAALVRLRQLTRAMPELIVVPAHDARAWDALPKLVPRKTAG